MRFALLAVVVGLAAAAVSGASAANRAAFASAEIAEVVDAGLMAPSVSAFRPSDTFTQGDFATVIATLGGRPTPATDPDAPVSIRELDARLVTLAGLRPAAREIRLSALGAGLTPRTWLGTETVARMLALRINHLQPDDDLELEVSEPATRAEAAYSIARFMNVDSAAVESVREAADSFALPTLTDWQRLVLARALRFVGSPYVFAGTSEKPQFLAGRMLPGGFDCSGFVWRVFKLQPFAGAPALSQVLVGRTTYQMSGEVPRTERIARADLEAGDIVFFGANGARSKPSEVGHMGIYLGNGLIVHSSRYGTTMTPMTGWYETSFAWGRRPLAEAGLDK
jgi:cell wall-associated NlpC family hydrolase